MTADVETRQLANFETTKSTTHEHITGKAGS